MCSNYCKCVKCAHSYKPDYEEFCNGYGDGTPFCGSFECIEENCKSTCIKYDEELEIYMYY